MMTRRLASERGHGAHGWLETYHTFSFADYDDPRHRRFHSLRVMNEDWIAPGEGFGMHPHRDMEILTHVLSGRLAHRDSLGNGSTIEAGDWQRMSAGSGILHSEHNPSADETVHLYQIWLYPDARNLTPEYEQRSFVERNLNEWLTIASPDGRDGSLRIHQDAVVRVATLEPGELLPLDVDVERAHWLQVLSGKVDGGGVSLSSGDGLAIEEEESLTLRGVERSDVLLFDLARFGREASRSPRTASRDESRRDPARDHVEG